MNSIDVKSAMPEASNRMNTAIKYLSYLLFTEPSIIVRWSSLEGEDFFAMHRGLAAFLGTVEVTERIQCSGDA